MKRGPKYLLNWPIYGYYEFNTLFLDLKKKSFCQTKIVLFGSNLKIFSNCFVLIATDVLLNIGQHSMQGSYIGPKSFKCCWINMAPNEIMGRAYMPLGIGLNNRETWIKFWTDRKKTCMTVIAIHRSFPIQILWGPTLLSQNICVGQNLDSAKTPDRLLLWLADTQIKIGKKDF